MYSKITKRIEEEASKHRATQKSSRWLACKFTLSGETKMCPDNK